MAALRQLLQRATVSSAVIRPSSTFQKLSYDFPFYSKCRFSTESPADPLHVAVAQETPEGESYVPSPSHDGMELEGEDGAGSKPRVANLPEDLTPEQLMAADAESGSVSANRGFSRRQEEEEEEELSMPAFAKAVQAKRRDPIVLAEAIRELKASARARFDETVEVHVRLAIDTRRSDQMVRGAATLPHGSGKVVRVAVFAEGAAAQEAESAGADVVGADDLVTLIQESGGKLNFDKCIATPGFMPKLGKVARILGPRGLMPNPKVGTVTNNVGEAVRAAKQGLVDFRADKSGIVHAGLGKVSFKEEALFDNIAAFTGALLAAKPTGLKKTSRYAGYVNSFTLSSTMGPGVRVTVQSVAQAADSYLKTAESR